MSESIEFTAKRYLGHRSNVTVKGLRRELTRLAKVVPDYAQVEIENVSTREGIPAYERQLVARWTTWA